MEKKSVCGLTRPQPFQSVLRKKDLLLPKPVLTGYANHLTHESCHLYVLIKQGYYSDLLKKIWVWSMTGHRPQVNSQPVPKCSLHRR